MDSDAVMDDANKEVCRYYAIVDLRNKVITRSMLSDWDVLRASYPVWHRILSNKDNKYEEIHNFYGSETMSKYRSWVIQTYHASKKCTAQLDLVTAIYCKNGHILELSTLGCDENWTCSAKFEPAGCRQINFKGERRYLCDICDFSYCGACFDSKKGFTSFNNTSNPYQVANDSNDNNINNDDGGIGGIGESESGPGGSGDSPLKRRLSASSPFQSSPFNKNYNMY